MTALFDMYDMTTETVELSNASLDRFPLSTYTACVHDVALNRTDLCIGDFWRTSDRLLMAPFTDNLFQDLFYLVTPELEGRTTLEYLMAPFRPFEPIVWILTFTSFFFFIMLFYLVEVNLFFL